VSERPSEPGGLERKRKGRRDCESDEVKLNGVAWRSAVEEGLRRPEERHAMIALQCLPALQVSSKNRWTLPSEQAAVPPFGFLSERSPPSFSPGARAQGKLFLARVSPSTIDRRRYSLYYGLACARIFRGKQRLPLGLPAIGISWPPVLRSGYDCQPGTLSILPLQYLVRTSGEQKSMHRYPSRFGERARVAGVSGGDPAQQDFAARLRLGRAAWVGGKRAVQVDF
jgi:hypothetical protein